MSDGTTLPPTPRPGDRDAWERWWALAKEVWRTRPPVQLLGHPPPPESDELIPLPDWPGDHVIDVDEDRGLPKEAGND